MCIHHLTKDVITDSCLFYLFQVLTVVLEISKKTDFEGCEEGQKMKRIQAYLL